MTFVVSQAVSMPGTLQIICVSLIQLTSDHLTDLDAVGKFWLFISVTLSHQIYF